MVGTKYGDPHKIVMGFITNYVRRQMGGARPNKTAEAMAHLLAGVRTSRLYRVDIREAERNVVAHEYLRGILADRPGV